MLLPHCLVSHPALPATSACHDRLLLPQLMKAASLSSTHSGWLAAEAWAAWQAQGPLFQTGCRGQRAALAISLGQH